MWIEPYNCFGRRGRKEPEVLAAASSKRLYVENKPYLVGGYSPHMSLGNKLSTSALAGSKYSNDLQKLKTSQLDPSRNFLSMAEKYKYMRETFKKRLAFGKFFCMYLFYLFHSSLPWFPINCFLFYHHQLYHRFAHCLVVCHCQSCSDYLWLHV